MKQKALVSVIVPVYKVEEYLSRCIDSLLSQTYSNFELILVDDGSPDRCGVICDGYASRDSRIKVIHKENGGLSDARNVGIAAASGALFAFVDSDDWVSPGFLMEMLAALESEKADICECSVLRTTGPTAAPEGEPATTTTYGPEEAISSLISDRIFRQHVWNKLYRRHVLDGILFPKGKTNEDEFWTYQVFGRGEKIVRLERTLYFYFQRSESIMGSNYNVQRLDALDAKTERQRYLERRFPALVHQGKLNLICSCIYAGQMSLKFLSGMELLEARRKINEIVHENHLSSASLRGLPFRERMWLQLAGISFWGTVRLKNWMKKGF